MPDTIHAHVASPRHLSRTTRAVGSAVRAVTSCTAAHPARVTVLHAPGEDELALAQHVATRLVTKLPDLAVALECAHPDAVSLTDGAHSCAVIDASERESMRALVAYRWEPNQPDTGQLAVTVDEVPVAVAPGAGVEVRVSDDGLDIWAVKDAQQREMVVGRGARRVEVNIVEGLHLLFRDETHVGDSPASVSVTRAMDGGARRTG